MLLDNVLWSGNVADESDQDENTVAIRAINDHVAADDRVEAVMLPIADGLTIAGSDSNVCGAKTSTCDGRAPQT